MRLDGKTHRMLDEIFQDVLERKRIKALLGALDYDDKRRGLVCARNIVGSGTIDPEILVITRDVISLGWNPRAQVLWTRWTLPN